MHIGLVMERKVLGDRYEVQKQLGQRTGRRTLLVRDLKTQELAVIKLLLFGGDFQWDDLKLFQREAEVLKSLSHSAIPRYLDFLELNTPNLKGFALVQTYIDAKSLDEQVKAGRRFTEAEVQQLAKSLLEILIYLHGCEPPVIHRDIKPSNILLNNRSGNSVGNVYLVDFGSVQTLAAKEGGTITVVGTYGYMPPEQFGGRTVPASDLYSLGATLIYLVTGTHPANLPQTDGRIEFEEIANISSSFKGWLIRMLQPYLDQRFSSAEEALQALEHPLFQYNAAQNDVYRPTLRQPAGSKVKLKKDANSLEIVMPSKENLLDFCFALFISSGITCVFSLFLVLFPLSVLFPPFGIPITVAISSIIEILWLMVILLNFCQIRLYINQKQLILTWKLLGLRYYQPGSVQRQDINKLQYTPRHLVKTDSSQKSLGYEHLAQLIIWAGRKPYHFGLYDRRLSEAEIEWLAYELSDWLGLTITQE